MSGSGLSARIATAYRASAFMTFNIILTALFFNAALWVVFAIRDVIVKPAAHAQAAPAADRRLSAYRQKFADLEAYTRISREEANAYLDQQDALGTMGFIYRPWTQFGHPEFHGTLLNTDANGFRVTRAPAPRSGAPVKVHVFGGSTTFGYGVPDAHTMPSYLQTALEAKHPDLSIVVKNFGQAFYYSSQELLLFMQQLKNGDVPAVAVFFDGGNDAAQLAPLHDEPVFTPAARTMWEEHNHPRPLPPARLSRVDWSWIPMVQLAQGILRRLPARPVATVASQSTDQNRVLTTDVDPTRNTAIVNYVVSRYTTNMRIIASLCRDYHVTCRFFWQPHVVYKYDRILHKHFPFDGPVPRYYAEIWESLEQLTTDNYVFLGDMFESVSRKIFVDDVHYNESTNEQIAARIADALPLTR
jgi:lysophospholipase L1-like esterase